VSYARITMCSHGSAHVGRGFFPSEVETGPFAPTYLGVPTTGHRTVEGEDMKRMLPACDDGEVRGSFSETPIAGDTAFQEARASGEPVGVGAWPLPNPSEVEM
jgi:hypothetical protein